MLLHLYVHLKLLELPTHLLRSIAFILNGQTTKSLTIAMLCLISSIAVQGQQLTAELSVTNARCHGLQGKLQVIHVLGGSAPFYYSIDNINFTTNPTLPALNPGNYTLFLRDNHGNTGTHAFTIGQPPAFSVELVSSKTEVRPNEEFTIEAKLKPSNIAIEKLIWRPQYVFPEFEHDNKPISILQNTMFWVEARDTAGCRANATLEVKVHESDIYFPNIISSKSATNEIFTVYAASKVEVIKEMIITDRYGKIMFRNKGMIPNDTHNGWDGRSGDSRVLPGVYFYECLLLFQDGKEAIYRGDITVLD